MTDTNDTETLEQPTSPTITCYDCTSDYHYLGTGLHEGVCPDCGSTAVDPAGELSFVRIDPLETATSDGAGCPAMCLIVSDASGREFEYWFVLKAVSDTDADGEPINETCALCWKIRVGGIDLDSARVADEPICPIPRLAEFLAMEAPERFAASVVEPVTADQLGGRQTGDRREDADGFGNEDDNFR